MNKPIKIRPAAGTALSEPTASADTHDCLRSAAVALDEILAAAHEAGDWRAVRVLHSVTALLAATRH